MSSYILSACTAGTPLILWFFFNRCLLQIVTDQQTGQKIQIVTALEPASPGKQQFILANADYSPGGKVILTKQEGSPNKVILASPDGSGVNQLLFASPELAGQQIQVLSDKTLMTS